MMEAKDITLKRETGTILYRRKVIGEWSNELFARNRYRWRYKLNNGKGYDNCYTRKEMIDCIINDLTTTTTV